MVLIIPTSNCINLDIKNIAKQMINIEQNANIFSSEVKQSTTCSCIQTHTTPNHSKKDYANSMPFTQCQDKFHIYQVPNAIYPEYPTTIEPLSTVGNIVIYLSSGILGNYLEAVIVNQLNIECQSAIHEIYNQTNININENITYNGIQIPPTGTFIPSGYSSSKHTLLYSLTDLNANRTIRCLNPVYTEKISSEFFLWNVYIIYQPSFSINTFLSFSTKKIFSHAHTYNNSIVDFIKLIKDSKTTYMSTRDKLIYKEKMKLVDSVIYALHTFAGHIISTNTVSMTCSSNTIILDAANLFSKKKYALKQLEYPLLATYNFPNFIDLNISMKKNGLDKTIISVYQKEYNLYSKVDMNVVMNNYTFMNKTYNKHLSYISWIPENERSSTDSINPLVFYLQYQSDTDIIDDILLDLSVNYEALVQLCKQKSKKIQSNNITFINNSDDKCYITGLPLWGLYYEIQFICTIKITPKLSLKVVVCMQVSGLGLLNLYLSHYSYNEAVKSKYFNSSDIFEYLAYLLNIKNTYKAEHFNLIIKKNKLTQLDIINKLKNDKYKKLLASFDQFGCCIDKSYALIVNPNTNDVFIGMHSNDVSDNLLINFQAQSDAYIFIISNLY